MRKRSTQDTHHDGHERAEGYHTRANLGKRAQLTRRDHAHLDQEEHEHPTKEPVTALAKDDGDPLEALLANHGPYYQAALAGSNLNKRKRKK